MSEGMTEEGHVEAVTGAAQQLAERLQEATEAGVSKAVLLPALITVFREAGMMPAGLSF